jgi:hypothetical protein
MNVLPCELRERAEGRIAMGEATAESLDNRLMMAAAARIEELEDALAGRTNSVTKPINLGIETLTPCPEVGHPHVVVWPGEPCLICGASTAPRTPQAPHKIDADASPTPALAHIEDLLDWYARESKFAQPWPRQAELMKLGADRIRALLREREATRVLR